MYGESRRGSLVSRSRIRDLRVGAHSEATKFCPRGTANIATAGIGSRLFILARYFYSASLCPPRRHFARRWSESLDFASAREKARAGPSSPRSVYAILAGSSTGSVPPSFRNVPAEPRFPREKSTTISPLLSDSTRRFLPRLERRLLLVARIPLFANRATGTRNKISRTWNGFADTLNYSQYRRRRR